MSFKLDSQYPNDFVSSIEVGQYRKGILTKVTNIGSLTKEQKEEFRSITKILEGKVVQFKADFKTDKSYKNPRFDCLRADKQPMSCIWEDD